MRSSTGKKAQRPAKASMAAQVSKSVERVEDSSDEGLRPRAASTARSTPSLSPQTPPAPENPNQASAIQSMSESLSLEPRHGRSRRKPSLSPDLQREPSCLARLPVQTLPTPTKFQSKEVDPQAFEPSAGYESIDSADLRLPTDHPLRSSNFDGNHLWHVSLPAHLKPTDLLEELSLDALLKQQPIKLQPHASDGKFHFVIEPSGKRRKVYIPKKEGGRRRVALSEITISRSLKLQRVIELSQQVGDNEARMAIRVHGKKIPAQVEGLRMRHGRLGMMPLTDEDEDADDTVAANAAEIDQDLNMSSPTPAGLILRCQAVEGLSTSSGRDPESKDTPARPVEGSSDQIQGCTASKKVAPKAGASKLRKSIYDSCSSSEDSRVPAAKPPLTKASPKRLKGEAKYKKPILPLGHSREVWKEWQKNSSPESERTPSNQYSRQDSVGGSSMKRASMRGSSVRESEEEERLRKRARQEAKAKRRAMD